MENKQTKKKVRAFKFVDNFCYFILITSGNFKCRIINSDEEVGRNVKRSNDAKACGKWDWHN